MSLKNMKIIIVIIIIFNIINSFINLYIINHKILSNTIKYINKL